MAINGNQRNVKLLFERGACEIKMKGRYETILRGMSKWYIDIRVFDKKRM